MNQKVVGNTSGKGRKYEKYNLTDTNLGLDADHSSDYTDGYVNLNNDNDMISNNPDGEGDNNDSKEDRGSSPLMDK